LAEIYEETVVYIFRAEESSETSVRKHSNAVISIVIAVRTSTLIIITAFLPTWNLKPKPHQLHSGGAGFVEAAKLGRKHLFGSDCNDSTSTS
jgi:hypothetical protein